VWTFAASLLVCVVGATRAALAAVARRQLGLGARIAFFIEG
jgi:hypothetical protein